MPTVFDIVPGSAKSRQFLTGTGALMAALSVALVWPLRLTGQAPTAAILLGGACLLFRVAWSTRSVRFVLSPEALAIQGDLFGRTVPRAILRADEARVVSLDAGTDLCPTLRTWGTAAPGYLSGWFRLQDRQKALAFVTDRRHVVYLPTTQGYALLLSVAAPEEFLRALRS